MYSFFNKDTIDNINLRNYGFGEFFYIKIEKYKELDIYTIYNADGTIVTSKEYVQDALYFIEDHGFVNISIH
ncbi:MAG: hypothetical protein Q8K37_01655 [Alphaproteobacteria bacterium]|jgi:hypothetical protein|nr:hypothetical protein [Alphaproteobacteria bacterium]